MGAVEQAKSLVGVLMKKCDDRTQELRGAIKKIEEMRKNLQSTFQGSNTDTDEKVDSAMDASITEMKRALQAVETSKSELAKCQHSL